MERQQKARKNNISRVARLKKQRRKRRISLLICGVLVIGVGFFIGYKLYIKNKCKDLGYAVEHYLTSKTDCWEYKIWLWFSLMILQQ